jgi:hypothetical protein
MCVCAGVQVRSGVDTAICSKPLARWMYGDQLDPTWSGKGQLGALRRRVARKLVTRRDVHLLDYRGSLSFCVVDGLFSRQHALMQDAENQNLAALLVPVENYVFALLHAPQSARTSSHDRPDAGLFATLWQHASS